MEKLAPRGKRRKAQARQPWKKNEIRIKLSGEFCLAGKDLAISAGMTSNK
jgi:hypothetical protein